MKPSKKELFYDSIADKWDTFIHKAETRKRMTVVFEHLLGGVDLKNRRFLDVGCGLGLFSARALELGAAVTGVDVGANLVKRCRLKLPDASFSVSSALELCFGDGQFDVVLCTEVIEHTEDPRLAVAELLRVLKPGGYLALTTPNKMYKPLFSFLSFARIRPYHGNENWLFTWDLKKLLMRDGNQIERTRYFNFGYPSKYLDFLEGHEFLRNFAINQGYLLVKKYDK